MKASHPTPCQRGCVYLLLDKPLPYRYRWCANEQAEYGFRWHNKRLPMCGRCLAWVCMDVLMGDNVKHMG